jgi:hypothetical protein
MQLENKPVEVGSIVWFPPKPDYPPKFKQGEVLEINETVRAVKLLFSKSQSADGPNLKRDWFPIAICKWSEPKKAESLRS